MNAATRTEVVACDLDTLAMLAPVGGRRTQTFPICTIDSTAKLKTKRTPPPHGTHAFPAFQRFEKNADTKIAGCPLCLSETLSGRTDFAVLRAIRSPHPWSR